MFIYAAFFYDSSGAVQCVVKQRTGHECVSCGFTRDFNAYLNLEFDKAINDLSLSVFLFFLLQFLYRSVQTVIGFENKKLIIADIAFSILLFGIAFYPLIVANLS